jgi:hypothetical protein
MPDLPAPEMRGWFTRFPVMAEAREDRYLRQFRLPGLSVKLRGTLVISAHGRRLAKKFSEGAFPAARR